MSKISELFGEYMKFKIASALLIFSFITFFSCSSKSEEELFNEAKEKIKAKDYNSAVLILEDILIEFPEGKNVAEVNFELGKLYHSKVITSINQLAASRKAVEHYKNVADNYQQSGHASRSLFMVAFIQANELEQLDQARENYNLFIEKYPNDELVSSAKAELDNLGISAEEILKQKLDENN